MQPKNKHRRPPCTPQERLQVYSELCHYEKYGCFSSTATARVRLYARKILMNPTNCRLTYETRKQRLINSILQDMKNAPHHH